MRLEKIEPAPDVARVAGLLERLVAIDTQDPPGREAEAAALLASQLEAIGFVTEVRPVADGRANVVARIDNGAGPCLAFNSHMDTVPVGGGWTSDPLRLTDRDGRLFARGARDAKGSITAMVEAGRLLASPRPLARQADVDVRRRRGDRRRRLKGSREAAAEGRLGGCRRADEQCGLRRAQGLPAAAHSHKGPGGTLRAPGTRRECDPRCGLSHVPV